MPSSRAWNWRWPASEGERRLGTAYVGRFAPSPTGLLHAGSLVAALASWLDARANGGCWLVRIEDTDVARCVRGAAESIIGQLAQCGLHSDGPVWFQSARGDAYDVALQALIRGGAAYACRCSRQDIARRWAQLGVQRQAHLELPYPGTCRPPTPGAPRRVDPPVASRMAWRFRTEGAQEVVWQDRRLGTQSQDVARAVGDVVLRRADGCWAYQLAVVVDDAAQGITDVVRGEDLADNTPRQILLQEALGLPTPRYLHTPLVRAADGQKLSKQTGAQALDLSDPMHCLNDAAAVLGLPPQSGDTQRALAVWTREWATRWPLQSRAHE